MKKKNYIVLIFVMILVLAACGKNDEAGKESAVDSAENSEVVEEESTVNEPVKLFGTFTTQTLEGEEVTDEIFAQANLTMVNIWGTFCGPCISEMPDLGELSKEYEDKGFQIVGMLCDVMEPGDEAALEIVEETKADYTHVIASDDLTMNVLQYVSSVPTTAFVDKEGNMVGEIYAGARDKEAWKLIINQYLAMVQ